MRVSTRPALAIMARAPIPGKVKTCLQPQLTPQECADVYSAFLRDTLDLALSVSAFAPFVAYTPANHKAYFEDLRRWSSVSGHSDPCHGDQPVAPTHIGSPLESSVGLQQFARAFSYLSSRVLRLARRNVVRGLVPRWGGVGRGSPAASQMLLQTAVVHPLPSPVRLLSQGSGDLGQRMLHVFERLGNDNYAPVLIVGSDVPTLQPYHLEQALACLDHSEVCLGPSHDGGYYLIGARRAYPRLFEGMAWSTDRVLEDTVARLRAEGISFSLLDTCNDVDTFEDLHRLRGEIETLKETKGARVPFWTEDCLKRIGI